MTAPRIALIHATPVAMAPVRAAFAAGWPEADIVDLLDDSLSADRARTVDLTPALSERIGALARYARKTGADAVLFTCSAFGRAIEAAAEDLDVPVLKPNEAMFEAALGLGSRIGMVATFGPAVAGMEAEFQAEAAKGEVGAKLATDLVAPAMVALRAGDEATHNRLVAEAAARLASCDAVMLAHFSTARAASAAQARLEVPVLASPDAAVAKIRSLLETA